MKEFQNSLNGLPADRLRQEFCLDYSCPTHESYLPAKKHGQIYMEKLKVTCPEGYEPLYHLDNGGRTRAFVVLRQSDRTEFVLKNPAPYDDWETSGDDSGCGEVISYNFARDIIGRALFRGVKSEYFQIPDIVLAGGVKSQKGYEYFDHRFIVEEIVNTSIPLSAEFYAKQTQAVRNRIKRGFAEFAYASHHIPPEKEWMMKLDEFVSVGDGGYDRNSIQVYRPDNCPSCEYNDECQAAPEFDRKSESEFFVHDDLRESNVFFSVPNGGSPEKDGKISIIDFNISGRFDGRLTREFQSIALRYQGRRPSHIACAVAREYVSLARARG